MIIAIRAQHSPGYDWRESLEALSPIRDIELAFFKPEDFMAAELDEIVGPIRELGITMPTLHMAHVPQTEWWLFIEVLTKTLELARLVRCRNIVLHPSYGPFDGLGSLMEHQVVPLLGHCNLLWETFPGKRRILTAWGQLAEFCERHERNYICYDICHMRRGTEGVIEDIEVYGHLIRAYHFSNWGRDRQHLPVGEGEIDFRRLARYLVGFEGSATLEYLPIFHDRLVEDALMLMEQG